MTIPKDFLCEETRSGYTVSSTMKKVWACQLALLDKFSKVCNKYGLHFWIDSGTLLGAVRHKGYIPWDDDIDVVMFRNDYDRLINIAQKEFKKPFILQSAYSEKHYVRGHAQLRDSRTTAIIPCEIYKKFNQGIFIDIFVMDYVPEGKEEEAKQEYRAFLLRDKIELRQNPLVYNAGNKSRLLRAIKYKLKYFTRKSFNRLYKRYEDVFRSNKAEDCRFVACTAWQYKCCRRDKHFYDETVLLDFEYLKMPAPKDYDKLLTAQYGEYLKPIQVPTCHGELIFDPNTPADKKIKSLRRESRRQSCLLGKG